MSLSPGTTVGTFEIVGLLGVGGMGEVYRARDTKLGRDVALKLLPDTLAYDEERVARFEREAKLLASLNHPNIAAIYGFDEVEGKRFLVLELVEGATLADRLKTGPLHVEESLEVARQIAEALESAHEKGVIHRDVKPANVKTTPEGKVKVLDFGLAKVLAEKDPDSQTDPANSPTITENFTRPGVILGTAAYMSPEQARGKPVDRRTDVWAFGCVLYEVLTGRRAFAGESISDTLAAVLKQEPNWDLLPDETPSSMRTLLRRALQKDPGRRLRDIGDARLEIEEEIGSSALPDTSARPTTSPAVGRSRIPWAVAAAAVAALCISLAITALRSATDSGAGSRAPDEVPQRVIRFPVVPPVTESYRIAEPNLPFQPAVAISRDGRRLVYVVIQNERRQLYLRELDQLESTPVAGTEGARSPFFSPDGQWVAFLTSRELRKVSLTTGETVSLCETFSVAIGGCWYKGDTILFTPAPGQGLVSVPADKRSDKSWEEVSTAITTPDRDKQEYGHYCPTILSDGKTILFTIRKFRGWNESQVAVFDPETMKEPKVVVNQAVSGKYDTVSGNLVFARNDRLIAIPFDPVKYEPTGSETVIVDGVITRHLSEFSMSRTGVIAYVPGTGKPKRRLVWWEASGKANPLPFEQIAYRLVRISPDGRRLAANIVGPTGISDVRICDLERPLWESVKDNRLVDESPVWGANSDQVLFASQHLVSGQLMPPRLVSVSVGTLDEQLLLKAPVAPELGGEIYANFPTSLSPNGKLLLFTNEHAVSNFDIWLFAMEGKEKPRLMFESTEHNETAAVFSPDGSLIAYQSDREGQYEVYVRPFPGPGRERRVSQGGGTDPIWARNAEKLTLYYRHQDKMMAVDIETEPELRPGQSEERFTGEFITERIAASYDVDQNGRFLMIEPDPREMATQVNVIVNWQLLADPDRKWAQVYGD